MTATARTAIGGPGQPDCRLADLVEVVAAATELADYPHADAVDHNVLRYDSTRLRADLATADGRRGVLAELARALLDGPGIVVFQAGFLDLAVVDRATEAFRAIIAEQHAAGATAGDHFAKPGANDRIWNALEKLALRDPETFAAYYANDVIAAAATAWLGPNYQVTSQVNVVNPGGAAQTVHRDYHLGFQTNEQIARYPEHVHRLSPMLTLQGAVAHSDMPVATGPTKYLPHSQKYRPGYFAWRRPEFQDHFEANFVQLPLAKGDAVFFNPAVFHAAGTNRTADVRRMANLLQISSAFGRAMESVDRQAMSSRVFPALLAMRDAGADPTAIDNAIAACAEGYSFPTNLDRDQPVDGLAPATQAELLARAVAERWPQGRLDTELQGWADRRRTADS
jgi:ectoine hydroxylase-related dioxygenase (phytanoyl-CoA dioxygenase family)